MENDMVIRESSSPTIQNINNSMVQTREMTEIQSMVISAKRFPRDIAQVRQDTLASCDSPALAEASQYVYSKGGTEITGASIRLAEELANAFTNLDKGWIELERKSSVGNVPGESVVQCYCWDMQRNVKAKRTFTVRHWRDTKKGGYALKDEREIYELIANQAARRLRACILEIIPKFIVEEAIERCDATLKKVTGPLKSKAPEMLKAFEKIGVTKEMIEKKIQRNVEAMDESQYGTLRKIYNSLIDGMSKLEQWFEIAAVEQPTHNDHGVDQRTPPATQSISKKAEAAGDEKPAKTSKPKNYAPTPEEIAAKKGAPLVVATAGINEPAFDPQEAPGDGAPTFADVWKDCAELCKEMQMSPIRLAEFTKEKFKKSPAEMQRENDVKGLCDVYQTLLQLKAEGKNA